MLRGSLHQTWIHYHKFPFRNQGQGERERESGVNSQPLRHCPHSLSRSKHKYVGIVKLFCVGKYNVCVFVCVCVCVFVCVCVCVCILQAF